jgi:hypothetical protein
MKTLARIGAGFSFTALFLAGVAILAVTHFRLSGEYVLLTGLGLFLVGTAFFAGTLLWLAAEKWTVAETVSASETSRQCGPWKIIMMIFCAFVGLIIALPLFRLLFSAIASRPAIIS